MWTTWTSSSTTRIRAFGVSAALGAGSASCAFCVMATVFIPSIDDRVVPVVPDRDGLGAVLARRCAHGGAEARRVLLDAIDRVGSHADVHGELPPPRERVLLHDDAQPLRRHLGSRRVGMR